MELSTYSIESAVEESHWWFVGRRRLFSREIAGLNIATDARVLDIGTSSGTNLRMLRDLGFKHVLGIDTHPAALRMCEEKGLGPVCLGDIRALPFDDASYDLVLATDVIEHVDDDQAAVREIRRVLVPNGHVLLTVPAFQSLWGRHDEMAQHKRRYRLGRIRGLFVGANLRILRSYYFNYLLFVPIWLARRLIAFFSLKVESENRVNSPAINALLQRVFKLDVDTAAWLRPFFGVSAIVIAKKLDP